MKKILVTDLEGYEKEVNPEDIEFKENKYFVSGEEILFTCGGYDDYQLFLRGALFAIENKVTKIELLKLLSQS